MIQVFSTKKNKPHHYGFTELDAKPEENTYGFNSIEFSVSKDGKDWISIYDVPDLEGSCVSIRHMLLQQSKQMNIGRLGFKMGNIYCRQITTNGNSK